MSKVVIKHREVQVLAQASTDTHSKSVELLRENDIVRALRVRCSCGEWTTLELEYPKAAQEPRPEKNS